MLNHLRPLLLFLLLPTALPAQATWDSSYYVSTKNRLNIGLLISERSYEIAFSPLNNDTSARDFSYSANAPGAIGIIADYDKLSLAVLFKGRSVDDPKKGFTRFSNFSLAIGGNAFLVEGGYRFFKGFYDQSSPAYLPNYTASTPFYQQPDLTANYVKIKGYYFTNRERFSFKSVYSCGYRQLKSAYTWVLTANLLHERLNADSALIPAKLRPEYGRGTTITGLTHSGFGAGAGFSGTLVFCKRFFANLTFVPSLHLQRRKYNTSIDQDASGYYLTLLTDSRLSAGYSGENFFLLLAATNDTHWLNGKSLLIRPSFISATIAVGFRFHIENSKTVKRVKSTGIYQKL